MFDANLLFSSGATVSTHAFSSSAQVNKTPADGVWLEIVVTTASGSLDVDVYGSTDTTMSTSADAKIGAFPQITAAGRYFAKVQTDKAYMALRYTVGQTSPTFSISKAGIVSGPAPDATV